MGKRIIQQARGKGSLTYRVRRAAFLHKIAYPVVSEGEAEIINLIHSAGHSAPLMKVKFNKGVFVVPAFNGAFIGQKILIGGKKNSEGNVLPLKSIKTGTKIYNIERNPGDGGRFMRSAGTSAILTKKLPHNKFLVMLPSKKEMTLSGECRATLGVVAGDGKKLKPIMKAGKKYYMMKSRSKLWPRVSAVAVNAIDHPFGSGRGKRVKSKIARRDAPPGKKVGHIRPRRTGRK